MLENSDNEDLKTSIETNILDSMDTLRTSNMIFKILSTSDGNFSYTNEIFCITAYYCTKLLRMRPKSIQTKFMGFFLNDTSSQSFFKRLHDYINSHKEKLQNGTLFSFYQLKSKSEEFSDT